MKVYNDAFYQGSDVFCTSDYSTFEARCVVYRFLAGALFEHLLPPSSIFT